MSDAQPLPDTNPKSAVGQLKPGFHAVPPVSLIHLGAAMEDGRRKYSLFNWRANSVAASVYYNAMLRHLFSWWDGENVAADSKVHHLGHVMACCAILLDAEAGNNLVDDRGRPGEFSRRVAEIVEEAKRRAASNI